MRLNFFPILNRYSTSRFLRAKLGPALAARGVAPHIDETAAAAAAHLRRTGVRARRPASMVTAGRRPALRRTRPSASWHLRSDNQPHWAVMRARRVALGRRCGLRLWFGFLRRPQRAQLGAGCGNAVEANQVQPGHQRSQPLPELQRRHHQMRGAVAPRGLELEHHLPGRVGLHALIGQGRARDVAAQWLQRGPSRTAAGRRRLRPKACSKKVAACCCTRRGRQDPGDGRRLHRARKHRRVPAAAHPSGENIAAYPRLDYAP